MFALYLPTDKVVETNATESTLGPGPVLATSELRLKLGILQGTPAEPKDIHQDFISSSLMMTRSCESPLPRSITLPTRFGGCVENECELQHQRATVGERPSQWRKRTQWRSIRHKLQYAISYEDALPQRLRVTERSAFLAYLCKPSRSLIRYVLHEKPHAYRDRVMKHRGCM